MGASELRPQSNSSVQILSPPLREWVRILWVPLYIAGVCWG